MEFTVSELIQHPLQQVYETYRDRMLELVPYLPNVDSIECLEREALEGGVRLLNRWKVSGAIPRTVRPFFSDKMLTYLDHARWRDADAAVDWHFEIGLFPAAVDCHGTNSFRAGPQPDSTEVLLGGSLTIDLGKIRGVPRIFYGLAPKVEKYVLNQVRPNLVAVSQAVRQLLDRENPK